MSDASLNRLYPYQREIAIAVLDSVFKRRGFTFTVEIARQGGKNEISAQLELLLLTLNMRCSQNLIKCSPTFKPQTLISMRRLKDRLNDAGFGGFWKGESNYIIRLGNARAIFLSAEAGANVVGNTAHLLLEIDEAQDVDREKYNKEFRPMGATSNVTSVLYGTTWDDRTLLEETKQTNLELARGDGIKRHFRYDWQEVAKFNPDYAAYVAAERQRLGENHPLFMTQYRLLPLSGGGHFLSAPQRAQLQGEHARQHHPGANSVYVAGIDLAGEAESTGGDLLRQVKPRQDATVVTIALVTKGDPVTGEPRIQVVEHYWWTGVKHTELYTRLVDIIKNVWRCRKVVVDATGIGQPVSSFLRTALGPRVKPFVFTAAAKSGLGFELVAAINSGRLKMYRGDGSPEYREFWFEMERARSHYRPNQTVNFYVDAGEGHDDFLMSLALAARAASEYEPREAKGNG